MKAKNLILFSSSRLHFNIKVTLFFLYRTLDLRNLSSLSNLVHMLFSFTFANEEKFEQFTQDKIMRKH